MLTREQILARKTGAGKATLPDGEEVAVRALTRDEVIVVQEIKNLADQDNYIIAKGMIDPVMSVEDVAIWASTGSAGDLVAVSEEIQRLSGLDQEAAKSRISAIRDGT